MLFTARNSLFFAALWFATAAAAQELSPRAYWPSPIGTKVATVGYSYLSGDIIPDRSLPITGVDSKINTLHMGYRQTINMWDRTANFTFEIPYSSAKTVGTREGGLNLEREYEGFGDLAATLSVNFLGAPAMNPKQFGDMVRDPHALLGGSIKLVAPTGRYNPNRLLNIGANRWAMKAELGYIQPLVPQWLLELSLGAWFFADNDDFLGFTKEQEPVATLQGHLIHVFSRRFWISLDLNYYNGGRSTIGERHLDDLQRDSKVGANFVYSFVKGKAVKFSYSKGSLNDSSEDFNVFFVSYQHIL